MRSKLIGNPKRVLCIGDSAEHDVAGGRSAGLTTLARAHRRVGRPRRSSIPSPII